MSEHPAAQMDEVHAELLVRLNAAVCVCGSLKLRPDHVFCNVCSQRLRRVCPNLERRIWINISTQRMRRGLVLYDAAWDVLTQLRAGRSTPARKHQEEHDGR